jgi:ribosomal protein S6--L-glutamate ligase
MKEEIIILSGNYKAKANKLLAGEVEHRGYKACILNPAKLYLFLSERNGWDLIYDNYKGKPERLHTSNIKAVIPRLGTDLSYNSFIINQFTNNLGIYSLQSANAINTASNKMKTLQLCSVQGLKYLKQYSQKMILTLIRY